MRKLRGGLIRILKGPTGGLLASLALAAFLGGVALAAPGISASPAGDRHGLVVSADAAKPAASQAGATNGKDVSSAVRSGVVPAPPANDHADRAQARGGAAHGGGAPEPHAAGQAGAASSGDRGELRKPTPSHGGEGGQRGNGPADHTGHTGHTGSAGGTRRHGATGSGSATGSTGNPGSGGGNTGASGNTGAGGNIGQPAGASARHHGGGSSTNETHTAPHHH